MNRRGFAHTLLALVASTFLPARKPTGVVMPVPREIVFPLFPTRRPLPFLTEYARHRGLDRGILFCEDRGYWSDGGMSEHRAAS